MSRLVRVAVGGNGKEITGSEFKMKATQEGQRRCNTRILLRRNGTILSGRLGLGEWSRVDARSFFFFVSLFFFFRRRNASS